MQTIIGINGTTGKLLAQELLRKGKKVRGISRRPFAGEWEHRSADALNLDQLTEAVRGSEVVYCCAGIEYNIKVWRRDWPILIENVIQASLAAGAKLVFLDNVYMYGAVDGEMTETTPMRPTSEKGKVRKAVAEALLDAFSRRGLRGCIARAADFYGPDCDNSMITATVFENVAKNKTAQMLGKADKKHSFTHVGDIARAMATLGTDARADGQVWHLPTAKPALTGREIFEKVNLAMGRKVGLMPLRPFFVRVLGLFVPVLGEIHEMMYQYERDYFFNSDKYARTFGDVEPISYEKGIAETAAFYLQKFKK